MQSNRKTSTATIKSAISTRFLKFPKQSLLGISFALLASTGFGQPSDGASPVKAKPVNDGSRAVRVVCMAAQMDTFLDPEFRFLQSLANIIDLIDDSKNTKTSEKITSKLKTMYPPVGAWNFMPVGSGFVVSHQRDADGQERSYDVTNWHVAAACPTVKGKSVQLGIIEATGSEIQPILADLVLSRLEKEEGQDRFIPVNIKALCKPGAKCSVGLPTKAQSTPIQFPIQNSENDPGKIQMYVPDVAVLQLRKRIQVPALKLELENELTPSQPLSILGFPQVAMQLNQEAIGSRSYLAVPMSTPGTYSRNFPLTNEAPGITLENLVRADMLLLAAQMHPGNSGGPVLVNESVVGMVTSTVNVRGKKSSTALDQAGDVATDNKAEDVVIPAGYALAVKATDIAKTLDFLRVPYEKMTVVKAVEPPPTPPVGAKIALPVTQEESKFDSRYLGIGLLALIVFGIVGYAIYISRKNHDTQQTPPSNIQHDPIINTTVIDSKSEADLNRNTSGSQPKAIIRLRVLQGSVAGTYSLPMPNGSNSLFVGRDPASCQLVFPNNLDVISRIHCCFSWNAQSSALTVRDISSTGTYVNGKMVDKSSTVTLRSGDTVDLGGANQNRIFVEAV